MKIITATDFKEAFQAAFIANRKHLLWNTNARRTALMTAYIYRTIADSFTGIDIEYEHNKIDAVLYGQNEHPSKALVAMEHENNVQSISHELSNLHALNCPLSVVITYTGLREEYLLSRQKAITSKFSDSALLLIVNKEDWSPNSHKRGEEIPWEFFITRGGELQPA